MTTKRAGNNSEIVLPTRLGGPPDDGDVAAEGWGVTKIGKGNGATITLCSDTDYRNKIIAKSQF